MAGLAERMGGDYGSSNLDPGVYARNLIPLMVDVAFAMGFYALAQFTDLSTAALSMALAGILVWLVQRVSGVDLLGGLASFGVIISIISAALAYIFQNDAAVKFAPSITHLIVGLSFAIDGLYGGSWLGRGLGRFLPFRHVDVRRLAWGMGLLSLTSASLNLAVANLAPTQAWLFYTTFLDLPALLLAGFFLLEWIQSGNAIEQ
jgi:intracellular septation protein A